MAYCVLSHSRLAFLRPARWGVNPFLICMRQTVLRAVTLTRRGMALA